MNGSNVVTNDGVEFARFIVHALEDKKASDILLLDLRPDTVIADFFILATGLSDRQLKALTEHVRLVGKEQHGRLPHAIEGTPDSGWMLIDYGDIIAHVFTEEVRAYYDLEGLWRREANVLLKIS
jgi:ribosome-associated protein